ncbi:MAG: flagellar biosynthesis anti-sigma factor FlgM [Candidatus Dadabacteria bacterium]|nr:MAG: flagellar biosynthesis anti-sigma factor FlgM [Candidatus Dadabacteria bacterium]
MRHSNAALKIERKPETAREKKVRKIKERIESGRYNVPSEAIVKAMFFGRR